MENKRNTPIPSPSGKPKSKTLRNILISLGIVGSAVGGFFAWKRFKGKGSISDTDIPDDDNSATKTTVKSASTSKSSSSGSYFKPSTPALPTRTDEFPLKKGSKGQRVKDLQAALIFKKGKSILPKYGADGDFGGEMETALTKLGYPKQVDENLYNILIKDGSPDPTSTAAKLFSAVNAKSYQRILDTVKTIRNASDYKAVNAEFKKFTPYPLEPVQVVTAAIASFLTNDQRSTMRLEFSRIGLQFDGKYWTLSGPDTPPLIITTQPTELIDYKHKLKVKVPANMVIGYRIKDKDGFTLFKTLEKNKKLVVQTSTIKNHETD